MILNLQWVLDTVFPPSDDEKLISPCTPAQFTSKLQPVRTRKNIIALASFKDRQVRAAIHLVKFHFHPKAAALLSELTKAYLVSLPHENYLVLPVPLSQKRLHKRGHNQAATIVNGAIAHLPQFCMDTHILIKRRHTPPQTTLSRTERMHNLTNAFVVPESKQALLANRHIIIVDDVTTTGSTLLQAKAACAKAHAASITLVAVAH